MKTVFNLKFGSGNLNITPKGSKLIIKHLHNSRIVCILDRTNATINLIGSRIILEDDKHIVNITMCKNTYYDRYINDVMDKPVMEYLCGIDNDWRVSYSKESIRKRISNLYNFILVETMLTFANILGYTYVVHYEGDTKFDIRLTKQLKGTIDLKSVIINIPGIRNCYSLAYSISHSDFSVISRETSGIAHTIALGERKVLHSYKYMYPSVVLELISVEKAVSKEDTSHTFTDKNEFFYHIMDTYNIKCIMSSSLLMSSIIKKEITDKLSYGYDKYYLHFVNISVDFSNKESINLLLKWIGEQVYSAANRINYLNL